MESKLRIVNRLREKLQATQSDSAKLLSVFVTAGYPKMESTPELAWAIEQAGADVIEIGIPFSDPIADGPTIQKSSQVALANGMNLAIVLEQIQKIRQNSQIPIILMGYLNPLLRFGLAEFMQAAEEAGVDGLIIPDLSPEEFLDLRDQFDGKNLGVNFLISPNTPKSRIELIDNLTSEFIYCVSVLGTTGSRQGVPAGLLDFLGSLRNLLRHPFLVGFGISNPEDASLIARHSDGIVVGSALIDLMKKHNKENEILDAVKAFVRELKSALTGA